MCVTPSSFTMAHSCIGEQLRDRFFFLRFRDFSFQDDAKQAIFKRTSSERNRGDHRRNIELSGHLSRVRSSIRGRKSGENRFDAIVFSIGFFFFFFLTFRHSARKCVKFLL